LLALLLAFPRIALIVMFFCSNYLQRVYHNLLILALGFVFLPLTTLWYAWLVNSHRHIDGVNLLILIAAVIVDVSGLGSGEYHRRR
jgi:UDP-N-acetylmuramyl pentapeptide phosphotransferase/UDP-N-acetylglucosamine-1-phosphate transferase